MTTSLNDTISSASSKSGISKLSIVIPCYNYGHFLGPCLDSVLAQTGVEIQAIVVDDASTDRSTSVAADYAKKDSRVQLISLSKNVGMVPAMNVGLREISGDYFVKLDADDLLPPGSLQRSVAMLQQHPSVGFVYGRVRHFAGEQPRPRPAYPRWKVWSGPEWLARRCQLAVNCISQPEAMIRSSTLKAVGDYNAGLPHTSDLEMWLRLATVSDVGRINGADQGYYRVHPDSMQRTVNSGPFKDLVGRRDSFLSALAIAGNRLANVSNLEATVRTKLAAQALDHACWTYDRDRTDPELEEKLIEFAIATSPIATTLPEWHRLEKHRHRGRRSRWAPSSLLAAAIRRTRGEIGYFRWIRTGV